MKTVGIADLKARLSEHLRYVRRGREVTILDRDTPIARLVPWHESQGLTIRKPLGRTALHDIPLPPAVPLKGDPLDYLWQERQRDR